MLNLKAVGVPIAKIMNPLQKTERIIYLDGNKQKVANSYDNI